MCVYFNTVIQYPSIPHLGFRPFPAPCAVDSLNKLINYCRFIPKECSASNKSEYSFKKLHVFGSIVCVLDPTIQANTKLST